MMNRVKYEKPVFEFNDLFLFDGIAETCWGYQNADWEIVVFPDNNPKNGEWDGREKEEPLFEETFHASTIGEGGGCSGVYNKIKNHLAEVSLQYAGQFEKTISAEPNAKGVSGQYIPIIIS